MLANHIGVTLTPPQGSVAITLDTVERHSGYWLFHFVVRDSSQATASVIGSGQLDQFVLIGTAPSGTPTSRTQVTLATPDPAYVTTHPALRSVIG